MKNDSVFTLAYGYRQRESKNNLENYTTEVFNYCFSNDPHFQSNFLQRLVIHEKLERSETQSSYDEGRPDIEFFTNSYHVIIECKIDSPESEEQLKRYSQILNQKKRPQSKLILLTKIYTSNFTLEFELLHWSDIKKLITDECNLITRQFGNFLNDKQIAMDNYFTVSDIVTLQNIHIVLSKMESVFRLIEPDFKSSFSGAMERTSRSSIMLIDGDGFYNERRFPQITIFVGFFWFADKTGLINIHCGICVGAYEEKMQKALKEILSEWAVSEDEWYKYVTRYQNILEIMGKGTENDQVVLLANHIKKAISELSQVKTIEPKFFE